MAETFETRIDRLIREAQDRGEFDNLPGAGKPLDLSDADDPEWWAKRKIKEEKLDPSELLPPTLQLRRERQGFPESLEDVRDEAAVRAVLEDFNNRVRRDLLAPGLGPMSQVLARTVDVEDMIGRWRRLRRSPGHGSNPDGSREHQPQCPGIDFDTGIAGGDRCASS